MKRKIRVGKSAGNTAQTCLFAVVASTVMSTAGATDWAALQRGFEALRPLAQQMDRDSENRRRQQEQDEARKEAERQRKAAAEAQAKAAEAQKIREDLAKREADTQRENALLSPPPEWAALPVIHRRILDRKASGGQGGADQEFSTKSKVAFSTDGQRAAYVNSKGDLVVRKLPSGVEQVVRKNVVLQDSSLFHFVGSELIQFKPDWKEPGELFDFQGNTIQSKYGTAADYHGRIVVTEYEKNKSESMCQGVAEYDYRGTLVSRLDLAGQGYTSCQPIFHKTPQLEVITLNKNNEVSRWVADQKIQSFKVSGPGRIDALPLGREYVQTSHYRDYTYEEVGIWDTQTGKKLCTLPGVAMLGSEAGHVYVSGAASIVDVRTCKTHPIGVGSITSFDEDYVTIYDESTGVISVLNSKSLQQVRSIETKRTGKMVVRRPKGADVVYIGPNFYGNKAGGTTIVYDIKSGAALKEVPGWLSYYGDYTVDDAQVPDNTVHTVKAWFLRPTPAASSSELQKFVEILKRDKYETSSEYRKRAEKASLPYQLDIDVKDYHADGSYFEAQYQGVSFGVPMPPAQARKLDGQARLTVSGQLRMLDEEFMIMRSATIKTADGTTISVPESKVPARRTPVGAAEAALKSSAQPASAGGASGVGQVMAIKTGNKAAGSCSGNFGYLASQLPAFTDSSLATARSTLLSQNIETLATELKGHGRTVSALEEPIAEGERVAAEAEQTAIQTYGGSGPSSIQKAKNGTLPLSFQCTGIHNSAVCAYIVNKWSALFYREAKARLSHCV